MERIILHSDLNNFYASVECLFNTTLSKYPMAVAGDADARHGIILSKNQLAKEHGVQTGEVLWQAKQKCPDLVLVPAHYDRYLEFSRRARELYIAYTDRVEAFGLDECWLDVTGLTCRYGSGKALADDIRRRIRQELGLTVSVGVSFNKVFAKLGSDLKKPDATTVISPDNYRQVVWSRPVSDLLYVGPATTRKLNNFAIRTIGDLARANPDFLRHLLGKNGLMLWHFANGRDSSGVATYYAAPPVKSVGNSTTAPRDLVSDTDVKITLLALCESVAARLREQNCQCSTVQLGIRDNTLAFYERQCGLPFPVCSCAELYEVALRLFLENRPSRPIRGLSVRACALSPSDPHIQLSLYPEHIRSQKQSDLERVLDRIRNRYGYGSVQRGIMLCDPALNLDAKREHTIHPVAFLR